MVRSVRPVTANSEHAKVTSASAETPVACGSQLPVSDNAVGLADQIKALDQGRQALLVMLAELDKQRTDLNGRVVALVRAFDAIKDPVFICDPEFRLLNANLAYVERAGVRAEEALGRRYWELFPRRDGPLPASAQCVSTGAAVKPEELSLPSGETYMVMAYALGYAQDSHCCTVHILHDVTEERRAEFDQRQRSEALAQTAEGIVLFDPQMRITYANPALCQMLGWEPAALTGHAMDIFIPMEERGRIPHIHREVDENGTWSGTGLFSTAQGHRVPTFFTAASLRDKEGGIVGYVGTYTDLRLIQDLDGQRDALASLIEELSTQPDLDSMVRHALRTAMTMTDTSMAGLAMWDAESEQLGFGWIEAEAGIPRQLFPPVPAGKDFYGLAFEQGMTRVVQDYAHFDGALPECVAAGITAGLAAPVFVAGNKVGVLVLASINHASHLRSCHVRLAETVARQIGIALQRDAMFEQVAEKEALLQRVVATVPDILFGVRLPDLAPTFVSPAVTDLLGFSPEEYYAEPGLWLRQIHEQDRDEVKADLGRLEQDGDSAERTVRILHRDGSLRWFLGRSSLECGVDGQPQAIFGVLTDMTARHHTEARLHLMQTAIDNSLNGVALLDLAGRITYVNRAFLAMAGHDSEAEVIGRWIIRYWASRKAAKAVFLELQAHGRATGQFTAHRKDGREFEAEYIAHMVPDIQGRPVAIMSSFIDITQRLQAEEKLQQKGRSLEVQLRELRSLYTITGLLHQLDKDVWEILQEVASTLPSAYQFPKQAVARISFEGREFKSRGFRETDWKQSAVLALHERSVGSIEVCYLKDCSTPGQGNFLQEEQRLLENIATQIADGIDHHRARSAQQASEARLRKLVNSDADGVLVLQDDGIIQFANPAAIQLLGRKTEELVGHHFGYPIVEGETSELELLSADKGMVVVEMRVADTEWDDNQAMVVSLHDITERRRIEQERIVHASQMQKTLVETVRTVASAMEKRDPYTAGHQQRVAKLSVAIAREMDLPEKMIEGLQLGALVHDIGKIYVPAEILSRPGRLTESEMNIVKSHVDVGYDIMKGVDFPWPIAEMVRQHHERIDGSGYPLGLTFDAICQEARILSVADVVEAMVSHRPYRIAMGEAAAVTEIRDGRGTIYDAEVVDACLGLIQQQGFLASLTAV